MVFRSVDVRNTLIKREGNQRPFLDKSALHRIVLAEGVHADHAGEVTSFIEKTLELAFQNLKYEEYKYSVNRVGAYAFLASVCLGTFGIGAVLLKLYKREYAKKG